MPTSLTPWRVTNSTPPISTHEAKKRGSLLARRSRSARAGFYQTLDDAYCRIA
jgi:hypothetical protein